MSEQTGINRVRRAAARLSQVVRGEEPASAPDHPGVPKFTTTLTDFEQSVVERTKLLSITGPERIVANLDAVRYVVARDIPGAFAECGVWRGGSVIAMILALQELGRDDRDIYMYDTFEGMTAPGEQDTSPIDQSGMEYFAAVEGTDDRPWPYLFNPEIFNEEMTRKTVLETGYPEARLHFVRGPVEETIPDHSPPDEIAILRLDTDFYESTLHELVHLYPRVATGGVVIIDDYGHWAGSKQAVDEYFAGDAPLPMLSRIDYSGRIGVKS